MKLTQEDIAEFAELWEQSFKEKIPPDEAQRRASSLLRLYLLLAELQIKQPSPPADS